MTTPQKLAMPAARTGGAAACCSGSRSGLQPPSGAGADPAAPVSAPHRPANYQGTRQIGPDSAISWCAVPGGEFTMGETGPQAVRGDGEGPLRRVVVEEFQIGATTVTNGQFAQFVDATGHRGTAARLGWSFVFAGLLPAAVRRDALRSEQIPWWCGVADADWCCPEGPGSDVGDRWDHPVVHVSFADAVAYCRWARARLPTEVEWEYAARGGLERKLFPWGDELSPAGQHRCNVWQGVFPTRNTVEDGYRGTSPVHAYEPNGYGLFQPVGNVWEWCADLWSRPAQGGPVTSQPPDAGQVGRVQRGGSYLCHASYCNRYRVAARTSGDPSDTAGNVGFRVVRR